MDIVSGEERAVEFKDVEARDNVVRLDEGVEGKEVIRAVGKSVECIFLWVVGSDASYTHSGEVGPSGAVFYAWLRGKVFSWDRVFDFAVDD